MADQTGQHNLVKLSDSDVRLAEPWEEIRGLDVYDSTGEQIGAVEDLYVDEQKRKVRFLDVGAGGFLGIGEKHFLIPVEALTDVDVDYDRMTINQNQEKVLASPDFDTNVVPEYGYQWDVYDYYGYLYP